jgi:hypothetical protein
MFCARVKFSAHKWAFVGFALLYGQPKEQLKQLLDCAVLGYGFRIVLTFHVKRFAARVSVNQ